MIDHKYSLCLSGRGVLTRIFEYVYMIGVGRSKGDSKQMFSPLMINIFLITNKYVIYFIPFVWTQSNVFAVWHSFFKSFYRLKDIVQNWLREVCKCNIFITESPGP